MQIEIPQEAEGLLRQRADEAGFESVEQYVLQRALISDEDLAVMEVAANDPQATALILEGLSSGPLTPLTAADWSQLREMVRQKASAARA